MIDLEARHSYQQALRARHMGKTCELDGADEFLVSKPVFYADSRLLIDDVRRTYKHSRDKHPPYGLINRAGNTVESFGLRAGGASSWLRLESSLVATAEAAFNQTVSTVNACPYHETLRNLGSASLAPIDHNRRGLDRLREVTFPGARLAPANIVNILRRMPAIARLNRATISIEELAHNSARSLLSEPLRHPQQWAKAFTFCLGEGYEGSDLSLRRDESFMPDKLIALYTTLCLDPKGREYIRWSMPTADFVTRTEVRVANRLLGSEADLLGEHITSYPIGTRLGDIKVDEPTIGCPGSQMAYEMWAQTVDVIVGEGFWTATEK
jgi:hypothetical protein